MVDFLKKNKLTILFFGIIVVGILVFLGIRYYRDNFGVYNPQATLEGMEIVNYKDNQYTVIYKSDIDVYRAYYKEFMNMLANDPASAFNKLAPSTKTSLFNDNYDNFLNYQKTLDKKLLTSSDITQYKKNDKSIYVVDKYDNKYVFIEEGVWNYTVILYK